MSDGGTEDKILDEYLRIINNKDSEVHRLLEEYEQLKAASHTQLSAAKDREGDLARRLAAATREAKQLRATHDRDAATIEQLVQAIEALKQQVRQAEANHATASDRIAELEAAQKATHAKHTEEAEALEAERAAHAAATEEAASQCQALSKALDASTKEVARLTDHGEALETALAALRQTHMPTQAHEAAVAALTAQLETAKRSHTLTVKELESALAAVRDDAEEKARAVVRLTRHHEELLADDARLRKVVEEAKREVREQSQAHQHVEETLRREVLQWKKAASDAGDRLAEESRERVANAEHLKRATEAAQEARVDAQRRLAAAEKTEEHLRAQLKTAQAQVHQLTEDADRYRRQHDAKEAALKEVSLALASVKEDAARQTGDLREKLATSTAAASSASADITRLQHELRQCQQQMADLQRRHDHDVNDLQRRLAEAEVIVQSAQTQQRDKEEELRLARLKHQQELTELKHGAEETVQRVRQHREAELQDTQARLERYRAEVSDSAGGHKGLARELELCADTHRQLRDAVAQHQQAARESEARVEALQREKATLQHELAAQTQALALQSKETTQARAQADAAQRAAEDQKAAQQRALEAASAAETRVREATAEAAKLTDQLRAKEAAWEQARHDAETHLMTAHQAKKDAMAGELERDRLAHRLAHAEGQLREAQAAEAAAQRELVAATTRSDELAAEVQRLQEAREKMAAECRRATQHAEEVEALARKTAEELQDAVTQRDATITNLRRDQGTAYPQLQEERTRNLVLQERLQHQAELANAQQAALRDRVAELEATLQMRQREVDAAAAQQKATEAELAEVLAQIDEMGRETDAHEKKHAHDQTGRRRAEEELAQYRSEVNATLAQMRAEVAAANEIRARYKKERARMDQLATEWETRVAAAEKAERAANRREAGLAQQLEVKDEALSQAHEELRQRASELRAAQQERSQLHEQSYQDALQEAAAAERRATELRMQLLEAQTAAATAQQLAREAQHRTVALQAQSAEAFAACALDAKETLVAAFTTLRRGILLDGGRRLYEGLLVAQRVQQESDARVRAMEQRVVRQVAASEGDRETAIASMELACQQELARMTQQHRDELARAARAETEVAERLRSQLRDAQRALTGERETTQDLQSELELCRVDRDHHAKRVADLERECRTYEERLRQATADVANAQTAGDELRRRWQETQVERRHGEEELRELRAEIAALQAVMAEKETQLAAEREQVKSTAARLVQSQEARDTLKALNHDLKEELDRLRQQAAAAEAAQRRGESSAREGLLAAEEKAAALQSELAAAKAEARRCAHRVEVQDDRASALTRELDDLRRREGDLIKQVQAHKGEISALRERCANLESLKNISDASVAEMQSRERDLLEKLEELRNSQQLMQLCFDKQQEQLEIGRRMRDQRLL